MGKGCRAAVRVLANASCLERRGLSIADLDDVFKDVGLSADVELLAEDAAELEATAARLAADCPAVVVAAGGDGTVHGVVNLVAPLRLPLGVLPLGTANDFARGLALPLDLRAAAAIIAEESPIAVDIGRIQGEDLDLAPCLFVNAAHLGLGVDTARHLDPRLKRWLGPLAYGVAAIRAWRESRPVALQLCVDDSCSWLEASQLLVGVGKYFGGGNRSSKDALDSGLFEVYAMSAALGPAEALEVAAALRLGTLDEQAGTLHFRVPRLTVQLVERAAMNMDGELYDLGRRLAFEVVPGGLGVYAPAWSAQSLLDPGSLDVRLA